MSEQSFSDIHEVTSLRSGPAFQQRYRHHKQKSNVDENNKHFKSALRAYTDADSKRQETLSDNKIRLTEEGQQLQQSNGRHSHLPPQSMSERKSFLKGRQFEESDGSSIFSENVKVNKDGISHWNNRKQLLNEVMSQNNDGYTQKNEENMPSQQTVMLSPMSQKINLMLELNLRLSNIRDVDPELFA